MRWIILAAALTAAACGDDSAARSMAPTAVSAPAPPPAPVFRGSVTETLTGAPVVGFTATVSGTRVTIAAPGFITRETQAAMATVDLIRDSAPFDLDFYRRFVRNTHDAPDVMQPLRRHTRAPRIYLRTVDEAGQPIDAATLDMVTAGLLDATAFTGGLLTVAGAERGPDTREGQPGWITVKWRNPIDESGVCGRAQVAGAWIEFNYLNTRCRCSGWLVRPRTVRHELGHAMGFWHTGSPDDLMSGVGDARCDQRPSSREQYHAAIAYSRPAGNVDVDVDPTVTSLRAQQGLVVVD